ncbi:MAG: tetratricopeptide repeat protein [Clostridium sp.]
MNNINIDIMGDIFNKAFQNNDIEDVFHEILGRNLDSALSFCENGLKDTKNPDYAIYLGHTYIALEEYEKALECIDIALESGSNYFVYAYNIKGEAFLELGLYVESRNMFNKVLKYDSDQLLAKEFLIELDIREELFNDAILKCNDYIFKYPENKKLLAGMKSTIGWIYMDDLNEPNLAQLAFEESLLFDKDFSRTYTGMGILHVADEKYREAISLFDKARNLNIMDSENYYMLALCYKHINEFKLVEELLLKAESLEPEDNRILTQLAFEMNRQKKFGQAINCFNKLLNLDPHDDFTWNDLGDCYKADKQYNEALNCYLKASQIDGNEEIYKDNIRSLEKYIL